METPRILLTGDSGISVEFGSAISPEIYSYVRGLNNTLKRKGIAGIRETIPTYRSLMIQYDPLVLPYAKLLSVVEEALGNLEEGEESKKRVIYIPVVFGGEMGEDLTNVAKLHGCPEEEIINLFCGQDFLIYMLGFTPGYPYIGGVPEALATPRLSSPRVKVPVGSVGVGGEQLGIYPVESPGGFQLVGRTPVALYDSARQKVLLEAGEYVRFYEITLEEYKKIAEEVASGCYTCRIEEV